MALPWAAGQCFSGRRVLSDCASRSTNSKVVLPVAAARGRDPLELAGRWIHQGGEVGDETLDELRVVDDHADLGHLPLRSVDAGEAVQGRDLAQTGYEDDAV